jgi:hypothetical protein
MGGTINTQAALKQTVGSSTAQKTQQSSETGIAVSEAPTLSGQQSGSTNVLGEQKMIGSSFIESGGQPQVFVSNRNSRRPMVPTGPKSRLTKRWSNYRKTSRGRPRGGL